MSDAPRARAGTQDVPGSLPTAGLSGLSSGEAGAGRQAPARRTGQPGRQQQGGRQQRQGQQGRRAGTGQAERGAADDDDDVVALYHVEVDGLAPTTDEDTLRDTFGVFGDVLDVTIPDVGRGVVDYGSRDEADRAVVAMHAQDLDGNVISVTETVEQL